MFPALKGCVSQLGAETGGRQDRPSQQVWMGILCSCFSSSSQAGHDQQLGDGNPPKKPFVSPATWGGAGTGAAAGPAHNQGDGRVKTEVGVKAEAVEGQ